MHILKDVLMYIYIYRYSDVCTDRYANSILMFLPTDTDGYTNGYIDSIVIDIVMEDFNEFCSRN